MADRVAFSYDDKLPEFVWEWYFEKAEKQILPGYQVPWWPPEDFDEWLHRTGLGREFEAYLERVNSNAAEETERIEGVLGTIAEEVRDETPDDVDYVIRLTDIGGEVEAAGYKAVYNEGLRFDSGADKELVVFDGSDVIIEEQVE